jgi:L-arabinonolactonase
VSDVADRLSIRFVTPDRDLLGESPLWDPREQALYWVDTRRKRVQRWAEGEALRHWATPGEVGSIALAKSGSLVLALADGFASLNLESGDIRPIAEVRHAKPPMRLNDGRTDREGRFLAGSMVLHRRDAEGALYRLELDGRVSRLVDGVAVSNGTCFSPDGRTLYYADSLNGLVRAWDYAVDGTLSGERILVDTRSEGSGPDGATVDSEGHVWIALVMAARVACYAPSGRLLRIVDVPVPYPTCPCFGGAALDTLYVTSIRDTGNILRSDHADAGALIEIKGLGVRGLPEVPYAGVLA